MKPDLVCGYVRKAHGLRGEVAVRTFDSGSRALLDVPRVLVRFRGGGEQEYEVDSVGEAPHGDLLLGLVGVETREDAERLVGSELAVFRDDLEAPKEGEYFQGDLIGLEAVTPDGARLGVVAEVWSTGPVPNLVIRDEGKAELIVPFVDQFVPVVDLKARRVQVNPPEYA